MWVNIKCIDREITIPAKFKNECPTLIAQEECSDFKHSYIVSLTSEQMCEAMELFYSSNNKKLEYNKILDYLCYKNMDPIDYQLAAEKFINFIKESKNIQIESKEIQLLTMKETTIYKISDVPKNMHDNIIFIHKNLNKIRPMIPLRFEIYFNNKLSYFYNEISDVNDINIILY